MFKKSKTMLALSKIFRLTLLMNHTQKKLNDRQITFQIDVMEDAVSHDEIPSHEKNGKIWKMFTKLHLVKNTFHSFDTTCRRSIMIR